MKFYYAFLFFILWSCTPLKQAQFNPIPNEKLVHIQAQPQGNSDTDYTQIYGCVKEYKNEEPVLFGSIAIYKNGVLIQGTETNFDGEFHLKPFELDSTANYTIEFSYLGFYALTIDDFPLKKGFNYELECSLAASGITLDGLYCPSSYEVPLIQMDNTTSGQIITSEQIKHRTRGW